ncbi:MAG TPA: TetR/AcrR family transcriptional regulator [Candidatus Binataceae bacterium]|nr:TetR/AcrR family transcriptional regulator [Candidatus Binataceae bacterium]
MPKLVDHEAQRAVLLDRAFEIMAGRGVDAVGMREIALELGVSTGMLYHYFPSKEDLFEQIVQRQCKRDLAAGGQMNSAPLAVRLAALEQYVLQERKHFTNQALVTFDVLRKQSKGSTSPILKRLAAGYREGIARFLEVSLETSELISSAVDGLVLHHLADPKGVDLEAGLRLLKELLLAGQTLRIIGPHGRARTKNSAHRSRHPGAEKGVA